MRARDTRRPARDIIDAVVANMHANRETLKYSTLAPHRYIVYLHPAEFGRLEGILPILRGETCRALSDALSALNQRAAWQQWLARARRTEPASTEACASWDVDFVVDPDDELKEGEIRVHSELAQPARPDLGTGERTRRITTTRSGGHTTTREHTANRATEPRPIVLAQLVVTDDAGTRTIEMTSASLTIGRGGAAVPVDVKITSSPDVSREHARIRHDADGGRFLLTDLSSFGTTLNGRHVPRGVEEGNGTKRENGAETPLPDVARIGLADIVFLEFRRVR
jgi:hypothetical protein